MSAPVAAVPSAAVAPAASPSPLSDVGLDDFSFHDFLSIINPLQHLPIVSTIYRALTGDSIRPLERVAGDSLYGGFWGFVSSVANLGFQEATGKDFGDTALALLTGDKGSNATAVAASATPSANTQVAVVSTNEPIASGPPRALQDATGANDFDFGLSRRAIAAYTRSLMPQPAASLSSL